MAVNVRDVIKGNHLGCCVYQECVNGRERGYGGVRKHCYTASEREDHTLLHKYKYIYSCNLFLCLYQCHVKLRR